MTTFEPSQPTLFDETDLASTSSAADSRVRTSASQEKALASKASAAAYGRNTPELLAKFDPDTSSWRTSQLCLDGALQEFSETWPRSGLMRSGIAFQLPPLVPRTFAIDSGLLLPTPSATSYGTSNNGCPGDGREEYATKGKLSLETMARRATWPTPNAFDGIPSWGHRRKDGKRNGGGNKPSLRHLFPTPTAGDGSSSGSRNTATSKAHPGISLTDYVRQDGGEGRMWASPAARDFRSGRGRSENGHTPQLPEQVGGQLNPTWVEWLMGLPLRWTVVRD